MEKIASGPLLPHLFHPLFKTDKFSSPRVLRNIGYPPLPASAPGVSCGQHKDYGLWTLLTTDETKGALQVYLNDPEGQENEGGHQGRWIDASPIEGCIVVNIGEMVSFSGLPVRDSICAD